MPPRKPIDPRRGHYGLVGDSAPMRKLRETIRKLYRDESTVLITGESGCGKELVARAVHDVSQLADKIFLPVDAASVVGSLMESELFGHKKGAFTGANEDKLGLVRAADGGTLFLDEIGELTLEVQAKLLRLLQEREVRPIGESKAVNVNVRVVAATNRDLAQEVARKTFRQDLYYRLNVISLRVPTLRDRPGDIPMLARFFLRKYGSTRISFSTEAMDLLSEFDWPGNVRELENSIRRAVALRSSDVIRITDLPSALRNFALFQGESTEFAEGIAPLAEVERRHILRVVDFTRGDISAAAMMLGIGRTTLYRKLKGYGSKRVTNGADVTNGSTIQYQQPATR